MSVDVGEAEVAAAIAVGEVLVIEAQEMEHGGVKVVNVDLVFDGREAEVIGGAVNVTAFDAASGHPGGEAVVVVVTSVDLAGVGAFFGHFDDGSTSEFSAPEDERFIEHAPLFEVL